MMDACNNLMLGVCWRLIVWVQDGRTIAVSNKFGDGYDSIRLVDVIIPMSWKEAIEQSLFDIQKGTGSQTIHKELKIVFNQNIWRDDGLGDINIFWVTRVLK